MKYLGSACLLGIVVIGCSKPSNEAPKEAVSASAAPSAAAPRASGSASGAGANAAPAVDPSVYSVVAQTPDAIGLVLMKGGAIATLSNVLFSLTEGALVQEPGFTRGIKKQDWAAPIGGAWPSAAFLEARDPEGKGKLYKWFDTLGGRWAEQQLLRDGENLLDMGVIGESVIAAIAMPSNDIRFALAGGKGGVIAAPAPVKKEAKADGAEGAAEAAPEEDRSCKVKMSPAAAFKLTGTASGHGFAAGFECQDGGGSGAPLIERWEPKKQRGTLESLPPPASGSLAIGGILAVSETDVYVWGGAAGLAYVAHFDGKAWILEQPAFKRVVEGMAAAEDGTVYAATGDGLYMKKAGGAWDSVPMPKPLSGFEATGVYARTPSDIWVSGRSDGKYYLLRSAKADKAAEMPSAKEVTDTMMSNLRWLATPLCAKPYAHLFAVGPSATPIPPEFPALKKAFEGKRFEGAKLGVEDDGRNLFVGAQAASVEQAQAIVKAFEDANPKMKARVFCHVPEQVKKEIPW